VPAPSPTTATRPTTATTATTTPSSTTSSTRTTATTATTTRGVDVTVRGVVATVSASAKVITLARPVGGVANVALTADTQIVRANGMPASLADVMVGATVEATGRPGTVGTLVARRMTLL
jgi:hypothetical protein